MKPNTKQLSVFVMMAVTVVLLFMDIKDIYYKMTMCGPFPSFSFVLETSGVVTDYDVTKAIRAANGSWLSPVNQWNALALQCDSLFPSPIIGKPVHLSALGVGCVLNGVKRDEELMFSGAYRMDSLLWATGLLGHVTHKPLPVPAYTNSQFALTFNLNEREYRAKLRALVDPDDIPSIHAAIERLGRTFAARTDVWETVLCYEMTEMVGPGESKTRMVAHELGCIWMDMLTNETLAVHIEPRVGKYYRALSEMMGLAWQTWDYVSFGHNMFIRSRILTRTEYTAVHTRDGERQYWHYPHADLGMEGMLYIMLMVNEIVVVCVYAADVWMVAAIIIRPLVSSRSSRSASSVNDASANTTGHSTKEATADKAQKDSTLSKMLLYTDLTSVSYRKPLLSVLLVLDVVLAWIYVVPNSYVFAWSTSLYQLGSAYLSMFRVWVIVLIVLDKCWKWTVVMAHEKLAALITEFTYVTSLEIMCSTLVAIYLTIDDIMSICLFKNSFVDAQRALSPTTPTILSFYASFSPYSFGDRSFESEGLRYIYRPLGKITVYGALFSVVVILARFFFTVLRKHLKGTLLNDVENFWRTYQRNSVEVFMNNPLRANALIRSQQVMSYRFGKSVFIRPFVYLEQNYYITRGKFRQRPAIPFLINEDAEIGADVDTKSYMLQGIYRDESMRKLHRKIGNNDVQIPLC